MNKRLQKKLDQALIRANGAAFKVLYGLTREMDRQGVRWIQLTFNELADLSGVDRSSAIRAVSELDTIKLIYKETVLKKNTYALYPNDLLLVRSFATPVTAAERIFWHFKVLHNHKFQGFPEKFRKKILEHLKSYNYRELLRAVRGYSYDQTKYSFEDIFKSVETIEKGRIKYFSKLTYGGSS